jgi:DNA-binding transcriptional LysR family regulator
MDIQRLREFVSLASYMRLSSAARELYISPSTLSQHISSLEKELGGDLFVRANGFELTPKGELALEHAQRILYEYDALLRDCSPREEGCVVTLNMPNYFMGKRAIADARRQFMMTHPGYRVALGTNELQSEDPVGILAEGRSELSGLYVVRGSGISMEDLVPREVSHIRVASYTCVFVSSPDHPLAGKRVLSAMDLNGATVTLKLCPVSSMLMEGVRAALERDGVFIRVIMRNSTRNSDAFLTNLGDAYVQWFEEIGGEPLRIPGMVTHYYERPIVADAYVLFMPERLGSAQLAYLEEVRRVARAADALADQCDGGAGGFPSEAGAGE